MELLLEGLFERDGISGKLDDTLVQLVECHLVSKECPAELGLVVDVSDLGDRVSFGGCLCCGLV